MMTLYRATIVNYGYDFESTKLEIHYQSFKVLRETEHFYIIKINQKERKIGKKAKSPFANISQEEALKNLWHRNLRHISILKARLQYANKCKDFLK